MVSNPRGLCSAVCDWSPLEVIPGVWQRGGLASITSLCPLSNLNPHSRRNHKFYGSLLLSFALPETPVASFSPGACWEIPCWGEGREHLDCILLYSILCLEPRLRYRMVPHSLLLTQGV